MRLPARLLLPSASRESWILMLWLMRKQVVYKYFPYKNCYGFCLFYLFSVCVYPSVCCLSVFLFMMFVWTHLRSQLFPSPLLWRKDISEPLCHRFAVLQACQPFFYLCLSSQNPPANSMWLEASGLQLWGVLDRKGPQRWQHWKQQLLCNLAEGQPCVFITGFRTDGTLFFLTVLTTWSVGSYLKLAQTTYLLFVIVCIPVTASFPAEMFNASVWLSTK